MRHIPWYQSWKSRHCWLDLCLNWEDSRCNSRVCVVVTASLAVVHRFIPPGSAETMWGWGAGGVKGRAKEPRRPRGPRVEPSAGLEHRHWPWPWMLGGKVLSLFIWLPSSSWKNSRGKLDDDSELKEGRPCRQEGKWQGSLVCRKF